MAMQLTLERRQFDRLLRTWNGYQTHRKEITNSILDAMGARAELTLKEHTPVRTGSLARAWKRQKRVNLEVLYNSALNKEGRPYLQYVVEGTGIYGPTGRPIIPVNKRAMYWEGAMHPVRMVRGFPGRSDPATFIKEDALGRIADKMLIEFTKRTLEGS